MHSAQVLPMLLLKLSTGTLRNKVGSRVLPEIIVTTARTSVTAGQEVIRIREGALAGSAQ